MMQTPQKLEEHKPLPRLPRGWSRLCHETSLFLRGIGLGIVPTILRGLFRKDFSEPQKVAVHQSRIIALFRALIHVVPLAVALMEIIWNSKGRYIGDTFDKQSYYQFAAKVHEITLQASLVSIVLSYIRFQLTFGDGLPFGAFLSGLQITQVSYLWSTELWSSVFVSSKSFRFRSKLALLGMVIICGLIAATAGPSSAVLLIPRQTRWRSESTYFYVNGTSQDLWPDRVDARNIPKDCAVIKQRLSNTKRNTIPVRTTPIVHHKCPIAEWAFLAKMISEFAQPAIFEELQVPLGSKDVFLVGTVTRQPQSYTKPASINICPNGGLIDHCGSCPQSAISDRIGENAYAYNSYLMESNTTYVKFSTNIEKDMFQPFTVSSCAFKTYHITDGQKQLQFAPIIETGLPPPGNGDIVIGPVNGTTIFAPNQTTVAVPGLHSVLTAPGNMSEYRLQWVNLPQDDFSNAAIGAVLLHPRVPESQSQDITTCTLGAGWGTTSMGLDSTSRHSVNYTITGVPGYAISANPFLGSMPGPESEKTDFFSVFGNISGYAYPQRRVKVSEEWAQFLNPTFIKPDGSNTTLMHKYLSAFSISPGVIPISKVMSIMFTFGLSSVGSELSTQAIPNSTAPCEGCLVFEVINSMEGWAYTPDGTFTKLSMVIMFAYCILAFGHIIYLLLSGVSSDAWNSTAEIVALAMNSSPTAYLHNTCAGIIGVNTFKTPVQILVRGDDNQTEYLELVFGNKDTVDAGASKLTKNKEYGEVLTKGYTTSVQVQPTP